MCTVKNVPGFVPVFLYAVTMLIFQIKRIIRIIQVKNGLTMALLFLFFWKMPKIWGRSDDAKQRKERGWPKSSIEFITCDFHNPLSSKSQMLDSPTVRSLEQSVRVLEEIV